MRTSCVKLLRHRWVSRLVIVIIGLMEAGTAYLEYTAPRGLPAANLHYVPILLGAFYYGYLGALSVSVTSVVLFHLSEFYLQGRPFHLLETDVVRLVLFLLVGLVTARLMEDRRHLKTNAQELAAKNAALEELNTRLQRVNDNKSKFVAVASHELRSPLTVIVGNAGLLLRQDLGESQRQRLAAIMSASKRLLHTVNNLLDMSRIETGNYTSSPASVDLLVLTQECIQMFHSTPSGHKLCLEAPDGVPLVVADREKIARVLTNLLSNAIKYSPAESKVTVVIELTEGGVRVGVQDQGQGIRSEDLSRIFQPYYRVNRLGQRDPGGAGLGLAICKELLEQHGSRLEVESEFGRGSLFSFVLPLERIDPVPANVATTASQYLRQHSLEPCEEAAFVGEA